ATSDVWRCRNSVRHAAFSTTPYHHTSGVWTIIGPLHCSGRWITGFCNFCPRPIDAIGCDRRANDAVGTSPARHLATDANTDATADAVGISSSWAVTITRIALTLTRIRFGLTSC
nr:protein En [Zea mays]